MKRTFLVAFCIVILCSLPLLMNVGIIMAAEPGYSIVEHYVTGAVTLDGTWGGVNGSEWNDAWLENISPTARFCFKMDTNAGPYLQSWLVEFSDNTNDAGDRWQICIDGAFDGGTAPQSGDHKIEIEGHTTLKVYQGNGTGWVDQTTTAVTWKDSLTTSPKDSTPHYLLEIQVDKGTLAPWGANPPPHGLRVAMYDASNPSQGWIAWPPTTPDDPSRWGAIATYSGDPIPETLSFGVVVLLSSAAVVIAVFGFRKRTKKQ